MRIISVAIAILSLAACGEDMFSRQTAPTVAPRAQQQQGVQVWPGSPQLGEHKRRTAAAVRAKGGNTAKTCLILAVAMQESESMSANDRDKSKDNAGLSKNYSMLNMNKDFLQRAGWKDGQGRDLNDDGALEDAVGWFMKGMEKMGEEGALAFHRGGQKSYSDRCSYGCKEYVAQIRQTQAYLLAHPDCVTNDKRIAASIPHV